MKKRRKTKLIWFERQNQITIRKLCYARNKCTIKYCIFPFPIHAPKVLFGRGIFVTNAVHWHQKMKRKRKKIIVICNDALIGETREREKEKQ